MANTASQKQCERWIRESWLPQKYGCLFEERNAQLSSGGKFKFDAVSTDGSIVASISTSRELMSSGKKGVGKLMKIRADMLFLSLVSATTKLLVFSEPCMFRSIQAEQAKGRVPIDIEIVIADLPQQLADGLSQARNASSQEVRPIRRKSYPA